MVGWLAQEGGTIEAVFGSSEKAWLWVILGISIVALLFAWYQQYVVKALQEDVHVLLLDSGSSLSLIRWADDLA